MNAANTVEEYTSQFPDAMQQILVAFRNIIRSNAPDVIESISYGMPAYKLNKKPLVYFAAYAKHIGFTPRLQVMNQQFKTALARDKKSKGSVQFPLNEPIPYALIEEMVRFII